MSDQKLLLYDTVEYLQKFDIVMLVETHQEFAPANLLYDYTHYGITAPEAGLRGYGISVFVRNSVSSGVSLWVADSNLDAVWLRFPGVTFGISSPVFLAACYVPPQGSVRLQFRDIAQRFDSLAGQVDRAMALGEVMLCGDFNASFQGDPSSPVGLRSSGAHGLQLLQICEAHDMLVFVTSPSGAFLEPTFQARAHTGATRPDHMMVSRALGATVHYQGVDVDRADSDHYPLVAQLDVSLPTVIADDVDSHVSALSRLVWDPEHRDDYTQNLANSAGEPAFAYVLDSLQNDDVELAGQTLMAALRGIALDSGMRERCPRVSQRTGARVQPFGKPWFDEECRESKRVVRQALANQAPREEMRPLRRAFNTLIRRKRRGYQRQRLTELLGELRERPKRYWDAFLPKAQRLPPELRQPARWTAAMRLALNPPCPEPTAEGIMEGSPPAGDGAQLLEPVTREEILQALVGLRNYKATGYGGCPTELLRYAIIDDSDLDEPLSPEVDVPQHLATLIGICFQQGVVPSAWNRMVVSPTFKKGLRSDTANYRPISVSDALAKLYAVVLNNRLVPWLEVHHLRAPTQAGFRPALGTSHPLFGLRHFIDVSLRTRQPLLVCFVDLIKAYDTVSRPLLWQIMGDIGVPPGFVAAVRSMYDGVVCQVRIEGCVGPEFESSIGVKQGCPLSPTLFGIFIDRLAFMIASRAGHVGAQLASGRRVPTMLYADDFCLITMGGEAVGHMHQLLRVVDQYNAASGMRANTGLGKTEMMLFGVSPARRLQLQEEEFRVGGDVIRFVMQYKYLGILHDGGVLWNADLGVRHASAQRSLGVMQSCLSSLSATKNIALAVRMYDVCVRTVQTYGSGVWATRYFTSDPLLVIRNDMEAGHLRFMRRWCRLRQNVPVWAIYAELGRLPLHYFWWREVLRLWNAIVALPQDSVWREIMEDNLASQSCRRKNWSGQVSAFLSGIGFCTGPLQLGMLDVDEVLDCLLRRYSSVWEPLPRYPRLAESQVALTTYRRWMSREDWLDRPGYLFLHLSHRQAYMFVRFKLGCHGLAIVTGRWQGVQRSLRICQRCHMSALDDERHLVFECPVFEDLRRNSRQLFGREVAFDMRRFFAHEDQHAVVMYILGCLHLIDDSS